MSDPLTASDFWPLILKLPHDGRVRLAKRAPEEFSSDDEPLSWEGQGWAELGAPQGGEG
jgi:hypothetical protein